MKQARKTLQEKCAAEYQRGLDEGRTQGFADANARSVAHALNLNAKLARLAADLQTIIAGNQPSPRG